MATSQPPSSQLADRTVLIVGSGSGGGIGYACARKAATLGARVILADLPIHDLSARMRDLPGDGHSCHHVDATDAGSVAEMLAAALSQHGAIDGAILAQGVLRNEPFADISLDAWDMTFDVNCRSVFIVGQALARHMMARRSGRIVIVGSNSGRIPRLDTASYGASKAAVIHLARCMALELGPLGVTVNALCPGSTSTSMMIDNQAKGDRSRLDGVIHGSLRQWRTGIPLGRLAEPEDQAAMATFLLTDSARHITGQAIAVDGGQTFF